MSKVIYGVLNSFKKQTKITFLIIFYLENTQDSDFLFFFGRIEDTIVCFRGCLTFNIQKIKYVRIIKLSTFVFSFVIEMSLIYLHVEGPKSGYLISESNS